MSISVQHILCVDDQQDTCDLVSFVLGRKGYRITTVGTIIEALRLVEHDHFDLYLLDSKFPDGSGAELCAKLRERAPEIPIVIYSADARPSTKEQYLRSCAQAFVTKQSEPEFLVQTIKELLLKGTEEKQH